MITRLFSHLARVALILAASAGSSLVAAQAPGLVISEYLANPAGTDSPLEYVELVATRAIDFTVTPYTVVVTNNGTATANGWIAGTALSYAFSITTGTVSAGNVVYVGGSGMAPLGTKLRTINTGTTAGDGGIGAANATGVLGNGGANADGIAIFDIAVGALTNASVPVDAIFFGTGTGTAVVSAGTAGYQLPLNDRYSGGKLQTTSFVALDPISGTPTHATGTLSTGTNAWTTLRTWTNAAATDGATTVMLTAGLPNLSIDDISVVEGDAGTQLATFTVSLSGPAGVGGVAFDVATADDTASSVTNPDFVAIPATARSITSGNTSTTVAVTVNSDTIFEFDETYFVNVSNVVGAVVTDGQGLGTITENDARPTLTATPTVTLPEGNLPTTTPVNITYTISGPAQDDATITVNTVDGSAMTGDLDYVGTSSTNVTIPAGDNSVVFSQVSITGDNTIEPNESFVVNVSNYYFGPGRRVPAGDPLLVTTVNITDDDTPLPVFSIDNVTVTETDAPGVNAVFTVTLAQMALPPRSPTGTSYSVTYTLTPGTATTADYDNSTPSGTLSFVAAGTQTISVPITGDLIDEATENFTVVLSNPQNATIVDNTGLGTIDDNDAAPTLSINDIAVVEGNAGTANASLTVTLSAPSSFTVTATASTADGTATLANNDYTMTTTPISFAPGGPLTQTVLVPIVGDSVVEANETLFVNLSAATNATILDGQGQITITNDDASADLSVTITDTPDPVLPGGLLTYTVTLTNSGPSNAENASFSLPLPANTTFNSLTQPGGWNCTTPAVGVTGTVSCNDSNFRALVGKSMTADKLAPGSAVFTIVVTVDALATPGTLLNTAVTASSTTFDPTPANNATTGSTTVGGSIVVPTAPIPTLDRFGQLLAALILMAVAALALRQRAI